MNKIKNSLPDNDKTPAYLFLLIPAVMLIAGYFLNPYPASSFTEQLILIPMYLGPIILIIGFLWRNKSEGSKIKIIGWVILSFFLVDTTKSSIFFRRGRHIQCISRYNWGLCTNVFCIS